MKQQIEMGFPDLNSGLILGLTGGFDGLSNILNLLIIHFVRKGETFPVIGKPNSTSDLVDKDDNIITRRYYGPDGKAIKDVDFTDHGNPKQHPKVPHEHDWDWSKKPPRGKWK
ncbi:hypothetical protein ACI7RC_10745 [Brevibacillus sp. B_LB10_24]|uniref:hypothetical protein n=1 Tax=Brevibacillus sp. B_LB10_24 TaxID=3380645 RepID=UPI0038B93B1B